MKKQFLVIIGAILFSLVACQKEDVAEEVIFPDTTGEQDRVLLQGKASGEFCRFTLQLNAKSVTNPITGIQSCESSLGDVCVIVECLPNPFVEINLPPVVWDPCQIIPCGIDFMDPWIINEKIDPREFRSFKDIYGLKMDEKAEGVPFSMNENILGVQFYTQPKLSTEIALGEPNPQPNVFYLKNKIILDKEVAKKMGLKGNIITPGKYPVLFNKENKTHNLMVVVERGF
ncbi:hypothetical protein ACWGOQ_0000185 [Aquimarina sp. M1]